MQYSKGRMHVRRLRGNLTSFACIRYRHSGPSTCSDELDNTTHICLVWIESNLNANRYISDILRLVVIPYLIDLPHAIFQQDNAKSHVTRRVLIFPYTQNIPLLNWSVQSPDLPPIQNIWSWVTDRLTATLLQVIRLTKFDIDLK